MSDAAPAAPWLKYQQGGGFDTKLSPVEEQSFATWKQQYAARDSGADYDLRGAFKAGLTPDPQTGHWPDTFKKPNHPTFSDQSQYATGTNAAKAGRWQGDTFIPPTAQEGPWTRYRSAAPTPNDTRGKARVSTEGDGNLSGFDHFWQGLLTGKDATLPGRMGYGMAEPAVGMMQMGARAPVMQDAMPFMPPEMAKAAEPDTKAVDALVQQREHTYEGTRQSAHPGEKLETDWARLIGNVASPVTLAAGGGVGKAMQGAGAVGRVALSAAGGAGIASTEPVTTGKNFGVEKAKQVAGGAVGGALGGGVGEGVGYGLGRMIAAGDPLAVERSVTSLFRRAIKPGKTAKNIGDIENQDRQFITIVDQINANKKNLTLTNDLGQEVKGQAPASVRQLSEAMDQTKRAKFAQYDEMAKTAAATPGSEPNRHLAEFTQASRASAEAQKQVSTAERAATMAAAQQSRGGNNVYAASSANQAQRAAQDKLVQARGALEKAQQAKAAAKTKAYSVRVDVGPIVRELRSGAGERFIRDFHPEIATKANRLAHNLETEGTLTLTETQDLIQSMNKELISYYKAHQGAIGDKLAPVAIALRDALDHAIESTGAPGYQTLKNQYGAFKAVEKDVAKAFQTQATKEPGGLAGQLGSLLSNEELIRALGFAVFDPSLAVKAAGRGIAARIGTSIHKMVNNPDRAIQKLFQAAETRGTGPSSATRMMFAPGGSVRSTLPALAPVPAGVGGGELGQFPSMPINP